MKEFEFNLKLAGGVAVHTTTKRRTVVCSDVYHETKTELSGKDEQGRVRTITLYSLTELKDLAQELSELASHIEHMTVKAEG